MARKSKEEQLNEDFKNIVKIQSMQSVANAEQRAKEKPKEKNEDNMNDSLTIHETSGEQIKVEVIAKKPVVAKTEREKFNNYIRKDLIKRLDDYREDLNMSRSNVLEEIIEKYLTALGR